MQRYQYRPGCRFSVPADVVGERLEAIQEREGLTAPAVVEDARDPGSPLHALIDWDDARAATEHRLAQARRIITSVKPIHLDSEGREKPVLGYIKVDVPDEGKLYVSSMRVLTEPELFAQFEAEALAYFVAGMKRYNNITSLAGVFREINRASRRARDKAMVATG